jgi:hypothetical protein
MKGAMKLLTAAGMILLLAHGEAACVADGTAGKKKDADATTACAADATCLGILMSGAGTCAGSTGRAIDKCVDSAMAEDSKCTAGGIVFPGTTCRATTGSNDAACVFLPGAYLETPAFACQSSGSACDCTTSSDSFVNSATCSDATKCTYTKSSTTPKMLGENCAANALCKPVLSCSCSGTDTKDADMKASCAAYTPGPAAAASGAAATAVSITLAAAATFLA